MNEFSLCSLTSYMIYEPRSEDDLDRKLELRAKKDRACFFSELTSQWTLLPQKLGFSQVLKFLISFDNFQRTESLEQ